MSAVELLALSLGLSLAAAALGWAVMRVLEGRVADPVLRERAWAAALYIPALPPLAVGLMLLTPAPLKTAAPAGAAFRLDVEPASEQERDHLHGGRLRLADGLAIDAARDVQKIAALIVPRLLEVGLRLEDAFRLVHVELLDRFEETGLRHRQSRSCGGRCREGHHGAGLERRRSQEVPRSLDGSVE